MLVLCRWCFYLILIVFPIIFAKLKKTHYGPTDGQTDGRTDRQIDGRTDRPIVGRTRRSLWRGGAVNGSGVGRGGNGACGLVQVSDGNSITV